MLLSRLPQTALGDRLFLFLIYVYAQKRVPRRNSKLFNDYIYFIKSSAEIHDVLRQYTSDKILVKSFIADRCGKELVLPTLGEFHSVNEIEPSTLPRPCVLKPAHSSGTVIFVDESKNTLDEQEESKLQISLESSPYALAREANYKNLRRRIICERMLPSGHSTKDYKVFCYLGVPKIIQVDSDRHTNHKRNLYTAKWEKVGVAYNFPVGKWESAPQKLSEMLEIASKLSAEFEFVRVDFFIEDNELYVAELTHCPESAHGRFESLEAEQRFSALLFSRGV